MSALDLRPGGVNVEVLPMGGGVFAHGSAAVARLRLRDVVRADRAVAPCGRWVPCGTRLTRCLLFKPSYRWQVRR